MFAAASNADLDKLIEVLFVLIVLAGAVVTLLLLYRGLWIVAGVGALITVLFAVFLL